MELILDAKCFSGSQRIYQHFSKELNSLAKFSIFLPSSIENANILFYLSGLGCDVNTAIGKSGFQRWAQKYNLIIVGPDTSPRGCDPDMPPNNGTEYLGEGAGGYIDAVLPPWKNHYRMFSYITDELPQIIQSHFVSERSFGIMGHSMGGHGAIMCGMRRPEVFSSVSALAPMSSFSSNSIGENIFREYLGEDSDIWGFYDAANSIREYEGPLRRILIDQGDKDKFLEEFLQPQRLVDAAKDNSNVEVKLRLQPDFDHSYYFVSTFLEDHFKYHSQILQL